MGRLKLIFGPRGAEVIPDPSDETPGDIYVDSRASLLAAVAGAHDLGLYTVVLREGNYGDFDDPILFEDIVRTNTLRLTSAYHDTLTQIPRLRFDDCSNFRIDHLNIYGEHMGDNTADGQSATWRVANALSATGASSAGCVINVSGCSDFEIDYNEIHGNSLATLTMELGVKTLDGIGNTTGGVDVDGINIHHNYMHDLVRGFRFMGTTVDVVYCIILNCYQSFGEFGNTDNHSMVHCVCWGIWANPDDLGDPHSAALGFTTQSHALVGSYIAFNMWGVGTIRFDTFLDVPGYMTGIKYNDTNGGIGSYDQVIVIFNLTVCNGGIGKEVSYCKNALIENNTIVMDPATYWDTTTTSLYWHSNDENVIIRNNIAGLMDEGALGQADLTIYDESFNNIVFRNSLTAADADLFSYATQFTGPFTSITHLNARAIFTPKVTSIALTDLYQAGCFGTDYYDWDTEVETFFSGSKPVPTTATGTANPLVVFDGTNDYATITDATDPFVGFSGGTGISVRFDVDWLSDVADSYVINASSVTLSIRRLSTDLLRMTAKNASNVQILEVDTSLRALTGDPHTVWWFSIDFANYKVRISKGPVLDAFPNVTKFVGGAMGVNFDSMYFMHNAAANLAHANIGEIWVADAFIDPYTISEYDKIVALNGEPVSSGADGKTLNAACKICLKGNAAAWNADTLNLATPANPAVVSGTLVDA